MNKSVTIFGLSALLLTACGTSESGAPTEDLIESGAVLELQQEALEAIEDTTITEAEALLLSYEEAEAVHQLVVEFSEGLDTQAQEALSDAIAVFSNDIEAFKYYVELADREPLLEDDHRAVLELTAKLEDGIALFSQVMDILQ